MALNPSAARSVPHLEETHFPSKDGTRLFHASLVPEAPRAVVAIIHGYGDHAGRYYHVMEAFSKDGFASHALDYRGHGKAEGRRGHCGAFTEYLDDLDAFLQRVRSQSNGLPLFIVAHSHGALVTATSLATRGAPEGLAGVVLSSPYFRLRLEPSSFQLFQAKFVGKLIPFLPVKNPLTVEQLTKDASMRAWSEKDTLRHAVVTPKWFTESNAAQDAVFASAGRITQPLLVVHGAEDPVAQPQASKTWFDAVASADKKYVALEGMLHEPFSEVARDEAIALVAGWMSERVGGAK